VRLLVTGAAGMLGHDVVAAGHAAGHDVLTSTRASLDLVDAGAVHDALTELRPDATINCAGYNDVDGAESDEAAADAGNAVGPANLAHACAAVEARMVHVSTDYVFDGSTDNAPEPRYESDPTGPLGAYGRSKLRGERAVADACQDHAIVRTAWLFGPHGANFVSTILGLARDRDRLEVVRDQTGSPTYSGHLAPALVAMAARSDTGLFHGVGGGQATWYALAEQALELADVACELVPVTAERFARPAPRPAWSVLGSRRDDPIALPPWREGLRAYLAAVEVAS
jgi:dTDP-4-dehydrorhamnose reductase